MRLTTKSEYALLAAIDLAVETNSGPTSARAISDRREIPLKFLEQILHALRREGIVTSIRGAHGGFVLAANPADLTVLDVVEAVEGPLTPTVCDAAKKSAAKDNLADEGAPKTQGCTKQASCAAAHVWIKASKALRDEFSAITLAQLASDQKSFDGNNA